MLATKPDDHPALILRTHKVEGEKQLLKVVLCPSSYVWSLPRHHNKINL